MRPTRPIANAGIGWAKPFIVVVTLLGVAACGDADRSVSPTAPATAATTTLTERSLSCDRQFVTRRASTITVLPTGTDDTHNLQCAIDGAARGDVVQLESGIYYTAQIMASDFRGAIRGRAAGKTTIENLPNLVVTVQDLFTQRPDAAHTWPAIFAFWSSDLALSDLTIKVIGEAPTTGWSIYGLQLRELALAVVMLGRTANIQVSDVIIDAQPTAPEATAFGTNLINGIYVEAAFAGNPDPLTGSFRVERSTFNHVADPFPMRAVDGFRADFSNNTVVDAFEISAGDLRNATVRYADNIIQSVLGFDAYDVGLFPYGVQDTRLIYERNVLSGDWGAYEEATFGPNVNCLFVNNSTSATANGLNLGAGQSVCKVVGKATTSRPAPASQLRAPRGNRAPFHVLDTYLRLHNERGARQSRGDLTLRPLQQTAAASSGNGGAPTAIESDQTVSGLCAFDIRLQSSGKAKMIVVGTPKSIVLYTSPALKATLTNLSDPKKQVTESITGVFHVTTDAAGNSVYVVTGRNLLYDPIAGFVIADGVFNFTLDPQGNLVLPLSGTGQQTDICALLS